MFKPQSKAVALPCKRSLHVEARFWITFILFFVLYFIAGSISNGWLFLLAASIVAALTAGLVLPALMLNNIKLEARCPDNAIAGDAFTVQVDLTSRCKTKLDPLAPQLLLLSHSFHSQPRPTYETLIGCLPDKDTLTVSLRDDGLPRGEHDLKVLMATSFPLGLVWHKLRFDKVATIAVYPKSFFIEGFFLYRIKSLGTGAFGMPKEGTSSQSIFTRSVRDYVRGDSPRNIHWMSTARTGRMMVREFDAEGLPYFDIQLDLAADWKTNDQFEVAVSTVASLIALGQRMGLSPELTLLPEGSHLKYKLPSALPGFETQMELLARIEPIRKLQPDKAFVDRARPEERTLVVVCPEASLEWEPANSFIIDIAAEQRAQTVAGVNARGNRLTVSSMDDIANL